MKLLAIAVGVFLTILSTNPVMAKDRHQHRSYNHYNNNHYSNHNNRHYSNHNNRHYDNNHYSKQYNYGHRNKHHNDRHYNNRYKNHAELLVSGIVGGIIGALITQPSHNRYSAPRQNNYNYYNPYE